MSNTIPGSQPNNPNTNLQQDSGSPLNSLSPIGDADEDGHYSYMLLWALQNRVEKDIKNIALTGPYGSGKSSILKTFERKYGNEKLVFLNISLATFKEEKGEMPSRIKTEKRDKDEKKESVEHDGNSSFEKQALLRLVELSILQQIFYHEKDEDIPDTRFKKTRSFSKESAERLTWGIFLFIISLIYMFYAKLLWDLFDVTLNKCLNISFYVLAIGILLVLGFSFIKSSIRPLRSIQLRKFNLQDAEFAVDANISKSILNEHLDELLYFFEVTPYTVVVFEDLDRFEQTEIFTKLRELNHLINYSKKMNNRKVAFVYAVRDEMFQDKDRTKFFDFIIPVIPVINSSNSNEILRKIVSTNAYNIKTDLLDDISLFVDDMRLLYNIMNEYYLYHKKLEIKDHNIMLAMVVYKNIYPNDFVALSNGEGELFNVIRNKTQYITDNVEKFDVEILEYHIEIKELERIVINDARELRKLYVLEYITKNPRIAWFTHSGTTYSIASASEENIFQYFIDNSMQYTSYDSSYKNQNIQTSFIEIEKNVDPENSYSERLEKIEEKSNDRIADLKSDIEVVENRKSKLKNSTLQELLKSDLVTLEFENPKQHQLVSILIRSGYIDENYMDYISFFYEGSLSRPDKEFLLNVKAHIKTDFTHKLIKVDKLISKIPNSEYDQEYVLNYQLIDYLLSKSTNKSTRSRILKSLSNETAHSISFIDGYINESKQLPVFIKELASVWIGMWNYINDKSNFTSDRINHYFKLILEHVDMSDLKRISQQSNFIDIIQSDANFLSILKDGSRIKQIIKELNIKFEDLNLENSPKDLVDFVFEGDYYPLDELMITNWVNFKGEFDAKEFDEQNYSLISNQPENLQNLIDYINGNLSTYITNVWLKLNANKKEKPEFLVNIFNNIKLSLDLKQKVAEINETKIRDVKEIEEIEVLQIIMDANKIAATWDNLFTYYKLAGDEFDDHIIAFLNNSISSSPLALSQLGYKKGDSEDKASAVKFAKDFILSNEIDNGVYNRLITRMPFTYNSGLPFENLSLEKTGSLLKILNVTKENYDLLREHHAYFHIDLLGKDENEVLSNLSNFEMDSDDIAKILDSPQFSVSTKYNILQELSDEDIMENNELLENIGKIVATDNEMKVSKEVLTAIFQSDLTTRQKVTLYLKTGKQYTKSEFYELMTYLDQNFNEIRQNGKHLFIQDNQEYWEFASTIYARKYIYEPKREKKGIRIRNLKQAN